MIICIYKNSLSIFMIIIYNINNTGMTAVVNKTTGRPNAVNVTGPGGEPVRQLCPGAAKAVAAERAKATTAARLRDGRMNASEEASARARVVPWEARAEVERDAVADYL